MNTLLKLQVEELGNAMNALAEKDKSFAASLCEQYWRRGLSQKQEAWVGKLLARTKRPATEAVTVGDMAGVVALFERARQHLKYPKILLYVPAASETLRLSVAGPRARVPGSINVASQDHVTADGARVWYGRINNGALEPSGALEDHPAKAAIVARLQEFATDPAHVAADHGRLTGHCSFCNIPLTDERSTGVGYGPICADHYGLPWGARPEEFGAHAC